MANEQVSERIVCRRCGEEAIPEQPWHKLCPKCFNKKLDEIAREYRARGYGVIDLRGGEQNGS